MLKAPYSNYVRKIQNQTTPTPAPPKKNPKQNQQREQLRKRFHNIQVGHNNRKKEYTNINGRDCIENQRETPNPRTQRHSHRQNVIHIYIYENIGRIQGWELG